MTEPGHTILALSAEDIVRLTGLTMRQLAHWDRIGFFTPEYAEEDRRTPNSRVYSFTDAVGLRTISILKGRHGVPTRHLIEVARDLAAIGERPWSSLRLRVWNRRVHFDEPDTGKTRDVPGQYVLVPIIDIMQEVEQAAMALRKRGAEQVGRFERHRNVVHNSIVLAGTRIPVATILEYLEDGYTTDQILRNFPTLTAEDIEAVGARGKTALAA